MKAQDIGAHGSDSLFGALPDVHLCGEAVPGGAGFLLAEGDFAVRIDIHGAMIEIITTQAAEQPALPGHGGIIAGKAGRLIEGADAVPHRDDADRLALAEFGEGFREAFVQIFLLHRGQAGFRRGCGRDREQKQHQAKSGAAGETEGRHGGKAGNAAEAIRQGGASLNLLFLQQTMNRLGLPWVGGIGLPDEWPALS